MAFSFRLTGPASRLFAPLIAVSISCFVCHHVVRASDQEPEGLVGQWHFDEAVGRLAMDSSRWQNHAMINDALLVKGVFGTGLQLNGQSSAANCASSPSLNPKEAITIEAWIRMPELPGSGFPAVVRKDEAYALRFSDGRLGFLLWTGGQTSALSSRKEDWAPDTWYHLVATYDGAQMRLFIDGHEDPASPKAMSGAIDASGARLGLGCSGSQHRFRGILDEVRLYRRALSLPEIQASCAAGQASLRVQKDIELKAQPIGQRWPSLKKPARKITCVEEGFLWIDAEDFSDYGGWLLDTQFVHLMGSAYLIAAGVGKPVEDATVDVEVPTAGVWRLWVRARNWLKDYAPGQFNVRVGTQASTKIFGKADPERWVWEQAGDFKLAAGTTRITLHDLTGYYGRCDALVLTSDLSYTPPNGVDQLRQERSRLTGLSLEPRSGGDYDVIVVGAGAAGSCAALAAARLGAKTALIQDRPVLGGNASIELGVPISGASCCHPNARESGVIEEVGRIKARYGFPRMSEPFRMAAREFDNLSVFLNQHVDAVQKAGDRTIDAVKAIDTLTGTTTIYRARMFLDCTGDGWVGYYAGAEYRLGRESREESGEDLAPPKADNITMSGCLMGQLALSYRAEPVGKPVRYVPPEWALKLPPAERFGRRPRGFTGGQWWLEHPGTFDDLYDPERARDELIRISFGYWNYIKNAWPQREQAANYTLTYVPITNAKRETRRLIGDYILTQNDVQAGTVFPDRISYGGWPLDVHHPRGILSGLEGPFDFDPHVPIYTIPFRCLYSKNVDNLLFAGRNASVTHVALGTVRVQGTLAPLGQAAGTAAAMCLERRVTPRELYRKHIGQLQQMLLKHDQYIPELANEDPEDLARTATVTASSTADYEPFGRDCVARAKEAHPLNMPRAIMFPCGRSERLESIALLLGSEASAPVEVTLHLREAQTAGDFTSNQDVAVAKAVVPPGRESLVSFPLACALSKPFAWVWIPATPGISWRLMSRAPLGSCRAYGGGKDRPWTVVSSQYYGFATQPPLRIPAEYAPENVINGVARIVGKATNSWASDPGKPLPQWLELEFGSPARLNTVYLTFDTDLNHRYHDTPLVRECVRDYEIRGWHNQKWITLANNAGNFQRWQVHRFETLTTSKLRLVVTATNGAPNARVFEIRAYHEE